MYQWTFKTVNPDLHHTQVSVYASTEKAAMMKVESLEIIFNSIELLEVIEMPEPSDDEECHRIIYYNN
jgi:hypothetical protein